MIKTTAMLLQELSDYDRPADKLSRMTKSGKYTRIIKELYETDSTTPGYRLAGSIYGPSYLSFDFALAHYGLIPEAVYTFTSATFEKKKRKSYKTPFGTFTYRDVPAAVYPFGIEMIREDGYIFQMASPEKALCDKLYTMHPVTNQKEMQTLLFEDLRIDETELGRCRQENLEFLAGKYPSTNVRKFCGLMRGKRK